MKTKLMTGLLAVVSNFYHHVFQINTFQGFPLTGVTYTTPGLPCVVMSCHFNTEVCLRN